MLTSFAIFCYLLFCILGDHEIWKLHCHSNAVVLYMYYLMVV